MADAFILHLIRHAPTAGNREKKYIGWTDEPVLPFECKPNHNVKHVWGSDLRRSRETAALLFPEATYHPDSDWRECHFGEWEGKTYSELALDERYRKWVADPVNCAPPRGESLSAVMERVRRAIRNLPAGQEFTVVSHGGPIRGLIASATGTPFWEYAVQHGWRYTLVYSDREACIGGAACISFSEAPLTENGTL